MNVATFMIAGTLTLGFTGCDQKDPSSQGSETATPPKKVAKVAPPAEIWKEFSGDNALTLTKAQVDIGPRVSGSEALEKTRLLIIAELERNGWTVERQTFKDQTPRGEIEFTNLIGRYGGSSKTQRYIVCSHFDTKVYDTIEFVGANDGASSTGALMELSRVLALDPAMAQQVELVFFDGEEAFEQFTEVDGLYGSRHYARNLRETGRNAQFKAGVLWDMIGEKDLTITFPSDSPAPLAQAIFAAADELGVRSMFSYLDRPILDDHIPLNQAKIPTIDLIDFKYAYWHTADDTLDKLSPESFQAVGAVTLRYLKTAMASSAP